MLSDSISLRIGGGFAILVAGALGVVLPVSLRSINDARAAPFILLLKAFAAGVILALATVHLLQEAYISLSSLPPGTLYNDFPITGVFVCAGVLIMFVAERLSLDFIASGGAVACGGDSGSESDGASGSVNVADVEAPSSEHPVHSHEHLVALTAAREAAAAAGGGHAHHRAGGHAHSHSHDGDAKPSAKDASAAHGPVEAPHAHAHAHPGMLSTLASSEQGATLSPGAMRRRVLIARLLEFSIVLHSLIIGLNLGTATGPHKHSLGGGDSHAGESPEEHASHGRRLALRHLMLMGGGSADADDHDHDHGAEAAVVEATPSLRPIVVLIIVLCFHQFFEGVALGSYIAELKEAASRFSKIVMGAIFALTVPVGCWVGIGISESYEPESVTSLWVTGSLNALTGGMLLYNALITFLAEEFSRDDLGAGAEGRALKRKMYLATLLGAACMALLGIWA